jgi:hypothetical protein
MAAYRWQLISLRQLSWRNIAGESAKTGQLASGAGYGQLSASQQRWHALGDDTFILLLLHLHLAAGDMAWRRNGNNRKVINE